MSFQGFLSYCNSCNIWNILVNFDTCLFFWFHVIIFSLDKGIPSKVAKVINRTDIQDIFY